MFIDSLQNQTNSLKGLEMEDFSASSKRRFLKFKERKKKHSAFMALKTISLILVLLCFSAILQSIDYQQCHYENAVY